MGDFSYLLDVIRDKFDYPRLRSAVINSRERWRGAELLIEDKGSGSSLIQDLRGNNIAVTGMIPVGDKVMRLFTNQDQFARGAVFFPEKAPWLDALLAELLGFPQSRYDDQVDSVTQALTWIAQRRLYQGIICAPIMLPIGNPFRDLCLDYTYL